MTLTAAFWFIAGALGGVALILLAGRAWHVLRARPRWAWGAAAVALMAAVALYLRLGSPESLQNAATPAVHARVGAASSVAAAPASGAGNAAAGSMESAVASLEQRLDARGGSDADWELLAKSYEFMQRPDAAALARAHRLAAPAAPVAAVVTLTDTSRQLLAKAEAARLKRDFKTAGQIYAQLVADRQMNADAWANYADVSATLNGNSLNGKPAEYVHNALLLDPAHPKALWLQGSLEHETRQYAAAVLTWQKLLATMDDKSSDAKLIHANIAEDTRLAGSAVAVGTQAGQATLRGEVLLSKALQSVVRPGQTLYIVAKSVNSPGMPVAVRRTQTGTWPVSFQLSDADAMLPERRLSTMGPVTVEARVSQSGQAIAAPGDLLGSSGPVDPLKSSALSIVIERELR